jgi:1-acyl-sn-glycerol-3-phosphate acyltransferase
MGTTYALARNVFARSMTRGTQISLTGAQYLPEGAAVLVCNHASDADPGVLMRALPVPVGFLAAPFMGKLPIFRTLLRRAGSVAIGSTQPVPWREQVRELLGSGKKLVVFPEGQHWLRAQDFSAGLAEFHPGFAAFAHEARVPVVPMIIERQQFRIVPFVTSPLVRRFSGNPEELEQTKHVLRHERCTVHVLEPIDPALFAARPKDDAVPWLIEHTRAAMLEALARFPPAPAPSVVERRMP